MELLICACFVEILKYWTHNWPSLISSFVSISDATGLLIVYLRGVLTSAKCIRLSSYRRHLYQDVSSFIILETLPPHHELLHLQLTLFDYVE